jgi:flagellar biogenesis protein FliO
MNRRRLPTLRARITAGAIVLLALPSLAAAFDAHTPQPVFGQAASPAPTASDAVPVRLAADGIPNPEPRRITPRGEAPAGDASKRTGLPAPGSILSALALVTLAIFAAARLWKLHGPKLPGGMPREAAEVLGRCRIESRQSLYLVRLGSRILVLGSGGGELTTLSEITDPAEVDLISAQCRSGGGGASPFSRLFEARQATSTPVAASAAKVVHAAPSPAPPTRATAARRLAERFRGHASDKEPGRAA